MYTAAQEDDLRGMSFVRGEGRQGNKQQLINGLLGFKMKIQKREVREHLYAQYLAVRGNSDHFATCASICILSTVAPCVQRCAKVYEQSAFAARGDVLKAIKLGAGVGALKKSPSKVPNAR